MITVNRVRFLQDVKLHAAALKVQGSEFKKLANVDNITMLLAGNCITLVTNRNFNLETRTACVNTQGVERSISINAKDLLALLEYSTDYDVEFKINEDAIKFTGLYGLPGFVPSERYEFNKGKMIESFDCDYNELKTAFNAIKYTIPSKDIRYYLNNAIYKKIAGIPHLLASDGHRLVYTPLQLNCETELFLPKWITFIFSLKANYQVKISIYEYHTEIQSKDFTFLFARDDVKYPNFDKVLNHNFITFKIDKKTLLTELTRLHKIMPKHGAILSIKDDTLSLSTRDVTREMAGQGQGQVEMGIMIAYALAATKACKTKEIEIKIAENQSCAMFSDGTLNHIIMAMRL